MNVQAFHRPIIEIEARNANRRLAGPRLGVAREFFERLQALFDSRKLFAQHLQRGVGFAALFKCGIDPLVESAGALGKSSQGRQVVHDVFRRPGRSFPYLSESAPR